MKYHISMIVNIVYEIIMIIIVIIILLIGLQVALGNADFHREKYRNCTLDIYGNQEYCP